MDEVFIRGELEQVLDTIQNTNIEWEKVWYHHRSGISAVLNDINLT